MPRRQRSLPAHPAADAFPMLPDAELRALAEDVLTRGLREPIVVLEGKVLDGRNRQAACRLVGVEAAYEHFDPARHGPTPLDYVLSRNVHRRHLTESQRALAAARLTGLAAARVTCVGAEPANLPVTQAEAGTRLRVSERSIRHALAVLDGAAPEVLAAVETGQLVVSAAAELARLEKDEQREVLESAVEVARERSAKKLNVRGLLKASRRTNDASLSQWDSTPELAQKMAEWLGLERRRAPRVLEPSAGRGALVRATLDAYPRAHVDACEIDLARCEELAELGDRVSVHQGDYLERAARRDGYDATVSNPPFDDGVEAEHIRKMMDETRGVLVLHIPARSMHGRTRHELVWSRVGREWWIRAEARLVIRPRYSDDGGRDEIVVLRLLREPGDCEVTWWELGS